MEIIDTHTHLYLNQFDDDFDEMILRSFQCGIKKFVFPSISSKYNQKMITTLKRYPENFFLMAGLHPVYVKENFKDEFETKDQEINKLKVIESEYNDLKAKYNKLHEQFIILKREQRSNILKIQEHEYLNKTISNKKNMNNLKVNDIISNLSNDDFNYEEPELKSIEKGTVSKKKLFELLLKKYDISNYNKIDTLLSEYSDKITEFDIKQIISNFK